MSSMSAAYVLPYILASFGFAYGVHVGGHYAAFLFLRDKQSRRSHFALVSLGLLFVMLYHLSLVTHRHTIFIGNYYLFIH